MTRIIIKIVLIAITFWMLQGCAVNPVTGEQQLMLISPEQDVQIGEKYAPEIEKQMGGKIADVQLQSYVNSIGQKLVAVSHRPDIKFHFTALNHGSLNAFALPGGYVFITKGMLKKLTSEAELAAILSHEIVHVTARHSSEAISKQIGVDLLLSVALSSDTPKYVRVATDLTRQLISLKYSRADETEADIAALDYMVAADYDPYAMVKIMQMLQNEEKTRPLEFFSSHPSPKNRVKYLTNIIRQKYPSTAGIVKETANYKRYVLDRLGD